MTGTLKGKQSRNIHIFSLFILGKQIQPIRLKDVGHVTSKIKGKQNKPIQRLLFTCKEVNSTNRIAGYRSRDRNINR